MCLFCSIIAGDIPSYKVAESDSAYAFLDIYPAQPYHTVIIPKEHCTNMLDVSKESLQGVMDLVYDVTQLYKEKLGVENMNILSNAGEYAGQTVFHLHYHIIPRSEGDDVTLQWNAKPELQEKFDELLTALQ